MALRFRRSVKLLPGVRLNLGLNGLSLSAGPRGASVNLGARGLYGNVGLPGTGLSYRRRLDRGAVAAASFQAAAATPGATVEDRAVRMQLTLGLDAQGRLTIRDAHGNPLDASLERRVRREHEPRLRAWLEDQEREIDGGFDQLTRVHLGTPAPVWVSPFVRDAFTVTRPTPPDALQLGFWDRVFVGRRERKLSAHAEQVSAYEKAEAEWQAARSAHEAAETAEGEAFTKAMHDDADTMEAALEHALDAIDWPRTTHVQFALEETGAGLVLDVDLPEIEDVPAREAAMAARGLKLNLRARTQTQLRAAYATLVHGVLFRVAGTAFAALPALQTVVVSGYSQRRDPATAQLQDDYLLSAQITRDAWQAIDFTALEELDVVTAFERFECVRDLSASGVFAPIEPLAQLPRGEGDRAPAAPPQG